MTESVPSRRVDEPDPGHDDGSESEPLLGPPQPASLARKPQQRWLGLIAFLVGIMLCLLIVLDFTSIANPAAFAVAVAAHGCLAVFLALLIEESLGQRRRPLVLAWSINVVLFGGALYIVDGFILDVQMSSISKWTYGVLSFIVFVSLLVLSFLLASPNHLNDNDAMERLARQITFVARRLGLGVAIVILLIGAAAWWRQTRTTADAPAIRPIPEISGTYVALGDSYSAGEGLEPFLPSPQPHCHRSPFAYPMLLSFENEVERVFRACSGAVTSDVDLGITGGHEPQLHDEPMPEVTLVTINIGGNDVVFSRVVQICFLYEDCIDETFETPEQDPARPSIGYPDSQPLGQWAREATAILVKNVDRVYTDLAATYPDARRIVVGYPHLFPEGGPSSWTEPDCISVLSRVGQTERRELRTLGDELNNALYQHAFAAGLEFVSPAAVWDGHEPCGREDQYTNAVKPVPQVLNPVDGGSFHPNQRGQVELARLVTCYLIANPEPPDAFNEGTPPGSLDAPVPPCD